MLNDDEILPTFWEIDQHRNLQVRPMTYGYPSLSVLHAELGKKNKLLVALFAGANATKDTS